MSSLQQCKTLYYAKHSFQNHFSNAWCGWNSKKLGVKVHWVDKILGEIDKKKKHFEKMHLAQVW